MITTEQVYQKWVNEHHLEGNNGGIQKHKSYILQMMEEYARLKCLEAIRNTRYAAITVIQNMPDNGGENIILSQATRNIQNIPNQEVMPEL